MRPWTLACLALLLGGAASAGDVEPIAAGRTVRRYTKGNAEYAVYAPKGWRREDPAPLVIHVPRHQRMPFRLASAPVLRDVLDQAARSEGFRALYAVVLLESHNLENHYSRQRADPERYVLLLERDAETVAEVVEAIAAEVPVDRGAVLVVGEQLGAETALGVALRQPHLLAGVVLRETESSLSDLQDPAVGWGVFPGVEQLRAARDLPVLIGYDPTEHNGDVRVRMAKGVHAILQRAGFRHLELLEGARLSWNQVQTPAILAWLAARAAEGRVRRERCAERDALLEKGSRSAKQKSLEAALRWHAKARALEQEHRLDAASEALWAELEAQGRALLAEADTAAAATRRRTYRKVAKLFAGTPLGDEAEAALAATK